MGGLAVIMAVALLVILVQILPVWVAVVVAVPLIGLVIDRVLSGPDRRLLRKMRKVIRGQTDVTGIVFACLPVTISGLEHPPRTSHCENCAAEAALTAMHGVRKVIAVVTTCSLSLWLKRGGKVTLVAQIPFGQLRGLRQVEGAYSLLGKLKRAPLDPDRLPLPSGSQNKMLLSFADYSSIYLRSRVRWDAALFHEAYSRVAGSVPVQVLTLLAHRNDPLSPTDMAVALGLPSGGPAAVDLLNRGLIHQVDNQVRLTDDGLMEYIRPLILLTHNLAFVDPMESPDKYRR